MHYKIAVLILPVDVASHAEVCDFGNTFVTFRRKQTVAGGNVPKSNTPDRISTAWSKKSATTKLSINRTMSKIILKPADEITLFGADKGCQIKNVGLTYMASAEHEPIRQSFSKGVRRTPWGYGRV